ncbi:MAG: sirohydrochlorin cobaltochelatase [Desulforhopalus sp.]|jgi:sirohydrochlorin cobaltochelatase
MNPAIVIIAFGTTTKAQATYRHLHTKIKKLLPEREIFWAYSSKIITKSLQASDETVQSPTDVLTALAQKGHTEVILQSLHLFPGTEFHGLLTIKPPSSLQCHPGLPLLTSPDDYREMADLLAPLITSRPDRAILILGHGTAHPSWTGYYSLEKILREHFGDRIHVGVVEQFPDSSKLAEKIASTDYDKVTIIPFFLIAGMHYRRDIIAEDKESWLSRLTELNMDVEVIDSGLGILPGLEKLLVRHINEAKRTSDKKD